MPTWEEYKKTMTTEFHIFEEARCGNTEALYDYLEKGGDIEICNHKGYTLLMLAAYHDHFEATEYLIESGANIDAADNGGNTVLMGAAFKGNVSIVKLLLDLGANPDLANDHNMTALDFARVFGRKEVLELLTPEAPHWSDPIAVTLRLLRQKIHSPGGS